MNEKRITFKGMSAFDTFLSVCLFLVMPWQWLLLIGAWVSNKNHLCDIEDKIDALSKPQKDATPYLNHKPTYRIDTLQGDNQIDTIRSYYDERPNLRFRGDS